MARWTAEPGESQAETPIPHTSTGRCGTEGSRARSPGSRLSAEPRTQPRRFPRSGSCAAGGRQRAPAPCPSPGMPRRECRARSGCPATGHQRHTGVAAPAAVPAPHLIPSAQRGARPPSLPGMSGTERQKCRSPSCLSGLLELQRGPAARRGPGLVRETPPVKPLPFCREGWVGHMPAPVPVVGPRPRGE